MSSTSTESAPEFEFSQSQNQTIGDLARKMSLVGFVMILFGGLQLVNGVMTLIAGRNPEKIVAAAKEAGMAAEKIAQFEQMVADGSWSSAFVASTVAFGLAGLLLLLVGVWTVQAAGGFATIVQTQGQDVSSLMGALEALRKKYGLMYYMILIAAISSLISFAVHIWHLWRGG